MKHPKIILYLTIVIFALFLSGCHIDEDQLNNDAEIGKESIGEETFIKEEMQEQDEAVSIASEKNIFREHCPDQLVFNEALHTYQGRGFSFQYPANAGIEERSINDIVIYGPDVSFQSCDGGVRHSGPFYSLEIIIFPNPDNLTAEQWARMSIISSWEEDKKRNVPLGAFPVKEEGEIDENLVCSTEIAGNEAFRADWFAFDSFRVHYYLANNDQIIVISFYDIPEFNHPLARVQQDIYSLILGTFSFNH